MRASLVSGWAMAALLAAMVLGCSGTCAAQGAPDAAIVAKATARAREIARATYGSHCDAIEAQIILTKEPKVKVEGKNLVVTWPGSLFSFDNSDGRLKSVDISERGDAEPKEVSLAEAKEEALRFFAILTGRRDAQIVGGPTEDVPQHGSYRFDVSPVVDGWPCIFASAINVDGKTGQATWANLAKDPKPWRTGQPVVGRLQVAEDLHRNLRRLNAFPRERWGIVTLGWMVPNFSHMPNEMGREHIAAMESGQSMLMYRIVVHDADTWMPEKNASTRIAVGYVDAVSGRTIALYSFDSSDPRLRPIGPPEKTVATTPLWPAPGAEIAVLGLRGAIAGATIEACEVAKAPADGVLATLVSGKDAWNVRFDKKSGVVWMEIGGKRVYGKPNAPLLKALEKVKPTKLTPFGAKKS